jgi:hypothetical protein
VPARRPHSGSFLHSAPAEGPSFRSAVSSPLVEQTFAACFSFVPPQSCGFMVARSTQCPQGASSDVSKGTNDGNARRLPYGSRVD